MNSPHYSISTPENVDLHLELAGLGSRIWAAFIDMALVYLMILLVVIVALVAAAVIEGLELSQDAKQNVYLYLAGITILTVSAVQIGYFILFEKLWQGQTPGKRIAQIRVIEANGQPVNWPSVILRNLIRFVDMGLLMIGVVVMIFDKNERRLGDLLGGTLVIRERQPELSARNLRISISDQPTSSFVDIGQITPDEYHLLVSFLRRRFQMETGSRAALAKQMEEYYRTKLNPEYKGESAENFLERLYLAYTGGASEQSA